MKGLERKKEKEREEIETIEVVRCADD